MKTSSADLEDKVNPLAGELAAALEQQSATGEILRVIKRSTHDVKPVFRAIADIAARLCKAEFSSVYTFDGDLIHFAAHHGLSANAVRAMNEVYPLKPSRDTTVARSILTGAVEQIADIHSDPDYRAHPLTASVPAGRSVAAVPMLKDGSPIGCVAVARPQPGYFPDREIKLLEIFADQAVIAIENARLFEAIVGKTREVTESLQQQTATAEVLKTISRATFDLPAVLNALVASALRLCNASYGGISLREGDRLRVAAVVGGSPEWVPLLGRELNIDRSTISGRVAVSGQLEIISDIEVDPEYEKHNRVRFSGTRALMGVPLLREGNVEGALYICRPEPGTFTERQRELVQTFADQAVIAIENVRLFDEAQQRNRELTASSEVLRVISRSPSDLQPVFDAIAKNAALLCNSKFAYVHQFDGTMIRTVAHYGLSPEVAEEVLRPFPMPLGRGGMGARTIASGKAEQVPDYELDEDSNYQRSARLAGVRSAIGVPMLRDASRSARSSSTGWRPATTRNGKSHFSEPLPTRR